MDLHWHLKRKQNMSKLTNYNRFTLGIMGGLLILSGTIIPLNAANTHKISNSSPSVDRENSSNYIALSWNGIWQQIKRKRMAGGSRGDNLCFNSPSQLMSVQSQAKSTEEIWHQNPLFAWQLEKLKAVGLKNGNRIYWQQEVKNTQTNIFYHGKPLQPGTTYTLVVFNPYETEIQKIQIVDRDKHQKIAADLAEIENRFKSEGADKEEIAFKKADYFAKRQMWSDALWEIYSIPNPSDELKEILEQLNTNNLCK